MKSKQKEKKDAVKGCEVLNMKPIPKELEIIDDESCHEMFPSREAMEELVYGISDRVDVRTFLEIADLMRGLDDKLAMKVAGYVRNFCAGCGRYVTGIDHIDMQLLHIYRAIYEQSQKGDWKLELSCPF